MRKLILTSAVLAFSLVAGHALAGDQAATPAAGDQPAAGAQPAAAALAPPPGPGLDLINDHCKFCHATSQVFAKKRSAEEWGTVIQTMIDRGAEVSPEDTKVIMDYLTAHYGTAGS
jgi:cytochrome c5